MYFSNPQLINNTQGKPSKGSWGESLKSEYWRGVGDWGELYKIPKNIIQIHTLIRKKDCETKWWKGETILQVCKEFPVELEGGKSIEELKFMNLINNWSSAQLLNWTLQ